MIKKLQEVVEDLDLQEKLDSGNLDIDDIYNIIDHFITEQDSYDLEKAFGLIHTDDAMEYINIEDVAYEYGLVDPDHLEIEEMVNMRGESEFLDEIGKDSAKEHFDLLEHDQVLVENPFYEG